MKYFYFHLIFFILALDFYSQQKDTVMTYDKLEDLLEDATLENEDSQIYDLVEHLINNPIHLNKASVNDLLRIPLMDIQTARAIIRHRNLKGGVYKPEDLQNIEGADQEIIDRILPFLKLGDDIETSFFDNIAKQLSNVKFNYRFRAQQDLQVRKGFSTGKFEGSRQKYYNRIKINVANKIYIGTLLEKDAGEKSFADFSSLHIRINDISIFKTIILGDYIFEFGQGLAIWSPYSFSKGTDAVNVLSKGDGNAVPYTSSDENQFLRGIALKLNFGRFTISPFFSYNKKDASVDSISNRITSLIIDGFHRTQTERRKENMISEKVFGTSIDYNLDQDTKFGWLYYRSSYSNEFVKTNQLKESGNLYEYLSGTYSTILNQLYLSGEIAYNMTSIASIHNATILVDKNFSIVFSFRNFPRNYFNIHASSFGERGTAQNELGFYSGIRLRTDYGIFNIYYDQFKFPLASGNYNFSSTGNDFLVYYTNSIFPNTEIRLKYKTETKDFVQVLNNGLALVKRNQQNFRAEVNYKAAKNVQLRTRIEYVYLTSTPLQSKESGYLFFQDIKYVPISNLNLSGRFVFFSTDSYNSRIYEFENDLIGIMSNPALYGEGLRWYFMARYSTKLGLNLSLKYSELYKPNERYLGSGDSEIKGNIDNRLNFQIDFNF
jgi:hypothetical protein